MPNLTEFSLRKHPQHLLYDDLSVTISNSLNEGKTAYEKKNYRQASLFIKGAMRYSDLMYRELDKVLDESSRDRAHYIIADCHLNHLNSPQHALESLRHIHDKQTAYGLLTSEYIAQSLYKKAIDIANTNKKLSEKLTTEAHFYSDGRIQALYNDYFSVLSNGNSQAALTLRRKYAQLSDIQTQLRVFALGLITPTANNTSLSSSAIFSLEESPFFDTMLSTFIEFDGTHTIPVLEKTLVSRKHKNNNLIYYLLGIVYHQQGLYDKSFDYLSKTDESKSELSTQCKMFTAFAHCNPTISEHTATQAMILIHNIFSKKKENKRTKKAEQEYIKILLSYAAPYAQYYLETKQNGHRKNAFFLADMCLRYDETYAIGIDIFTSIYNSNEQFRANTLQSNTCITIAQHFKKYDDDKSLKCLSTVFTDYALHHTGKISLPHFDVQYLECALDNNTYSEKEENILKEHCAALYYGLCETKDLKKKLMCLKKAADYGKDAALLDLAYLICDKDHNISIASTINDRERTLILNKVELLAHNDTVLPLLRSKGFDLLGRIGEAFFVDNNKQSISYPLSPEITANYLDKAYQLNENGLHPDSLLVLAKHYMIGIKNKETGDVIFKRNYDKARRILENVMQLKTLTEAQQIKAQFFLAQAYYSCGKKYHQEASNLFLKTLKTNILNDEEKREALIYMCALKLHTLNPNSINQAAEFFYRTIGLVEKSTFLLGDIIDDTLYNEMEGYALTLIKAKDKQNHTLDLCVLLGEIFYGQKLHNSNSIKNQTAAVQCLQYAANCDKFNAQFSILVNDQDFPEINLATKIQYLDKAKETINHPTAINHFISGLPHPQLTLLKNFFEAKKAEYCAKPLKEKYECIKYLHEQTSEKELEKYLGSDYFNHIPDKSSPLFSTDNGALAQLYFKDTILEKYIIQFKQLHNNGVTPIPPHITNVVYNYTYALMNSSNHNLIKISSEYLEKLLKNPAITHMLSVCYYKLGVHPSLPERLGQKYLKQSAELENEKAINRVKEINAAAEAACNKLEKAFDDTFKTPREQAIGARILLAGLTQKIEAQQKK